MNDPLAVELAPGTELGDRFEIKDQISRGAMGAVYRALDRELGSDVAVKRLLDVENAARFEIEARLLSQLRHPRVVRVTDYFQDESGHYLVMDLVSGTDLGEILKERGRPGLPVAEAVEHALQACEALQYVHEQLIVHRDVKPQNLILGEDGIVLVDFGIARQLGDEESPGTVGIGTPRFIAPEVFAEGAVSPRSDVYGLAATLWTLLAGRTPVYAEPTSLSELVAEVTPELEATLRAGLELVPERRVVSVEAFAKALGSPLIGGQGVPLALSVEKPRRSATLMEQIVRTAAGVFDASACSIGLVDRMTGELVYQSAWGAGAKEIVGVRLAPGTGIGGTAVATGRAEAVDCRNDPRFAAQIAEGTGYVPYTMLVVPLIRDDKTVGVLSLLDRRDGGMYGPEDMDRAALFADLALTALDVEPDKITNPGGGIGETEVADSAAASKPVESAGEVGVGTMVGGYRVEAILGVGGMGHVYRAADADGAPVAVKLINRDLASDPTFRRRFDREAQIARQISHPNLVPVLDVGEHEGVPFMVQRFVGFGTLADRIARSGGRLPLAEIVDVSRQVGGALDALHAGGVVHRDMKPANVLFDENDVAYVTDFGLAKVGEGTLLTRPGEALGSLNYMAPEQVRGAEVSAATDVYGLGCAVYECVTGVPLFADREGMDVLYAQLGDDPPDPRAAQPELPEEAAAVILHALAKDPGARPQSAGEFANELERAAGGRG